MSTYHLPVVVAVATLCCIQSAGATAIRDSHPRIYLTADNTQSLRSRWTADNDADLKEVINFAERRLKDPSGSEATVRGAYPNQAVVPMALAAYVTQDSRFVVEAMHYADIMMGITPAAGGDTAYRNRLLSLAVIYDWLNATLSSTRRAGIDNAIVAHMELTKSSVNDPDVIGGHSRWANVTTLAGCLALIGHDSSIDGQCDDVIANWKTGYAPALDTIGAGGGHHMGWQYGAAYSGPEAALMWWSATSELWNSQYLYDAAFFELYGADENLNVPAIGDCWNLTFNAGSLDKLAVAAAIGKNAYAESFVRNFAPWGPNSVIRSIFKDTTLAAKAPTDLPHSRHFSGSGFVIVRDRWDGHPALFVFKSSPFYSYNHHHRDENAFTLSYKGPLLLDAGFYDAYGSDHHTNFYTRSIAHNTLLVTLPNEDFRGGANDGGQHIPPDWNSEPRTIDDIRSQAALGGVEHYASLSGVTWVRGDASRAYVVEKLTTYVRDVLYIEQPEGFAHPVMLVVDQVALPTAREARILWQLAQAPTISGTTRALIDNAGGGHARLEFLAPEGKTLQTFSGSQRFVVDGANHPPTEESGGVKSYWGRLEVVAASSTMSVFSTAIAISDDASTDAAILRLHGDGWEGARIGRNIAAVAISNSSSIDVSAAKADIATIAVAGLSPSQYLDVRFSDGNTVLRANDEGLVVGVPGDNGEMPPLDADPVDDGNSDGGSGSAESGDNGGTNVGNDAPQSADHGEAVDDISSTKVTGCAAATADNMAVMAFMLGVVLLRRRFMAEKGLVNDEQALVLVTRRDSRPRMCCGRSARDH